MLSDETREAMAAVAVQAAKAVDYEGAGTVEFMYGSDGSFYFLEMNTRLQVEHPITEMVTGSTSCMPSCGWPPGSHCGSARKTSSSMVTRSNCASTPRTPVRTGAVPGLVQRYREPTRRGHVDGAMYEGAEVPIHYDPMISKLVVWGEDRPGDRARRACAPRVPDPGCPHIDSLLPRTAGGPGLRFGVYSTGFLSADRMEKLTETPCFEDVATIAAAIAALDKDHRTRPRAQTSGNSSRWKWSLR